MDYKKSRLRTHSLIFLIGILVLILIGFLSLLIQQHIPEFQPEYVALFKQVRQNGTLSVIVGFTVEGSASKQADIDKASANLIAKLSGLNVTVTLDKLFIPYIVLTVDEP